MNIEERAAQAAAWKATGQCNCAQAVMKAFEDKLQVDADTLMKLGAGYAAGMGCMESTCGARIGAVMVAGLSLIHIFMRVSYIRRVKARLSCGV